jgi:hypothetical protein
VGKVIIEFLDEDFEVVTLFPAVDKPLSGAVELPLKSVQLILERPHFLVDFAVLNDSFDPVGERPGRCRRVVYDILLERFSMRVEHAFGLRAQI